MAARRILTLAAFGALISDAAASPRSDPTSGRAVFTGATAPHSTSINLSPAAIGFGEYNELYFAFTSTLTHTRIDGSGVSVSDTSAAPGGVISYLWRTSESLRLGFEAQLPPSERFLGDYDQLRYHTLGGGERRYAATVGVSLRLASRVFVGASLTHENLFVKLRYARDAALAGGRGAGGIDSDCDGAPCGIGNPAAAERWNVAVRSPYLAAGNLRVNVGAVVRLAEGVWLGLAYHTPPGGNIQTTLDGTVDITTAPRAGAEQLRGAANVTTSYPASVDAEVRFALPRDLEGRVGGRWEDLSRWQAYDVRATGAQIVSRDLPEWTQRARGLHDAFALWGGVEQIDRGDIVVAGGRLGFETSALDNNRTSPQQINPLALTFDAGIQLRAQKGAPWVLQLSYGLAYFPSVSVTDSAYDPQHRIDCIDSGYDYTTAACAATRAGYALPTTDGTYGKFEHAVRLGVRYDH